MLSKFAPSLVYNMLMAWLSYPSCFISTSTVSSFFFPLPLFASDSTDPTFSALHSPINPSKLSFATSSIFTSWFTTVTETTNAKPWNVPENKANPSINQQRSTSKTRSTSSLNSTCSLLLPLSGNATSRYIIGAHSQYWHSYNGVGSFFNCLSFHFNFNFFPVVGSVYFLQFIVGLRICLFACLCECGFNLQCRTNKQLNDNEHEAWTKLPCRRIKDNGSKMLDDSMQSALFTGWSLSETR